LGKQTGLICSLTHLRIDNDHPLAADIQSYQKKRSMRIALQDGKTGKALRIAKQNRRKKVSESKNILTKTAGWVTSSANPPHPIIFG
jgi:hypothetical protein